MNKVWRVARTEYLNLLRSKAFLVTLFLMPIFMGGAVTVQALVGDQVDLRERRVAVIDGTGRLLAAGVAMGLALMVAVSRVLHTALFGVASLDALTLGLTVAALTAVTLIVSIVPARRAASIDPLKSLRAD